MLHCVFLPKALRRVLLVKSLALSHSQTCTSQLAPALSHSQAYTSHFARANLHEPTCTRTTCTRYHKTCSATAPAPNLARRDCSLKLDPSLRSTLVRGACVSQLAASCAEDLGRALAQSNPCRELATLKLVTHRRANFADIRTSTRARTRASAQSSQHRSLSVTKGANFADIRASTHALTRTSVTRAHTHVGFICFDLLWQL